MTLTANQAAALWALTRQELPTIREIAEVGRMSRSSAQGAVMALVRLGLASQAGSASSGGATFTLTDAGRVYLDSL